MAAAFALKSSCLLNARKWREHVWNLCYHYGVVTLGVHTHTCGSVEDILVLR